MCDRAWTYEKGGGLTYTILVNDPTQRKNMQSDYEKFWLDWFEFSIMEYVQEDKERLALERKTIEDIWHENTYNWIDIFWKMQVIQKLVSQKRQHIEKIIKYLESLK